MISCEICASAALDCLPPQLCDLLAAHRAWSLRSAACLNALTKGSGLLHLWPQGWCSAAKQPRVTRQRLSGDRAGCPAAAGRSDQKVPTCLEALEPQGCCICLGSDGAGWISITDDLLSIPLSQNAFIPH